MTEKQQRATDDAKNVVTLTTVPNSDPFDPAALIASRRPMQQLRVAMARDDEGIPVGRPGNMDWFRVNPNPDWQSEFVMLRERIDDERYLVMPNIASAIEERYQQRVILFVYWTARKVCGVWPVNLENWEGNWHVSARTAFDCALQAQKDWIQLMWRKRAGKYEAIPLPPNAESMPDPVWPADYLKLITTAFAGNIIKTIDHPILRQVRGHSG